MRVQEGHSTLSLLSGRSFTLFFRPCVLTECWDTEQIGPSPDTRYRPQLASPQPQDLLTLCLHHGSAGVWLLSPWCQERGQKRDSGTRPSLLGQRALVREPRVPLCPTQTCGSGRPFTEPWGDWARPHPSLCSAVSPAPSGQTPHRPRLEGQRCLAWGQGPARDAGQAEGAPLAFRTRHLWPRLREGVISVL